MSHKNDPDYHDIRATTLLEASHQLRRFAQEQPAWAPGIEKAAVELRRMASNARRAHTKVLDRKRRESRDSEARAEAFGMSR